MAVSRIIVDKNLKSTGKTISYLEDISHKVGIYKWRNKTNNKVYIGKATNLTKRKNLFLCFNAEGYAGKFINAARQKYNNSTYWDYEILEYCIEEKLNEKEIQYIELYDTTNRELGYNLSIGGEGSRGYKMTEEAKEKLSIINKGKTLTKEHCKKISEALKGKFTGNNSSNYGKKLSDERKEKLRQSKIRKVKQLNKDTLEVIKIWDSITEATKSLGFISSSQIPLCCSGKRDTAFGYKWCYAEDEKPPVYIYKTKCKPIIQLDLNGKIIKEYNSMKEAAEILNIRAGNISNCCRGKQKTAFGFKWRYK